MPWSTASCEEWTFWSRLASKDLGISAAYLQRGQSFGQRRTQHFTTCPTASNATILVTLPTRLTTTLRLAGMRLVPRISLEWLGRRRGDSSYMLQYSEQWPTFTSSMVIVISCQVFCLIVPHSWIWPPVLTCCGMCSFRWPRRACKCDTTSTT